MGKSKSLTELLAEAPLFNWCEVEAKGGDRIPAQLWLPDRLKLECQKCDGQVTSWTTADASSTPALARYTCANCENPPEEITFALRWDIRERSERGEGGPLGPWERQVLSGTVTKYGQFPAPRDRISKQLEKQLGAEHAKYYRTAVRLRNFGLGVGALTYLRRVVEDTANQLVDIVHAEAVREGEHVDAEEVKRIREGRNGEAKISLARRVLPRRLMVGGHNPLDKLYAISSEGLHGKSDSECVEAFDAARLVFEYFFEELPQRNEREAAFTRALSTARPASSSSSRDPVAGEERSEPRTPNRE